MFTKFSGTGTGKFENGMGGFEPSWQIFLNA
jgi:hypothetical protein